MTKEPNHEGHRQWMLGWYDGACGNMKDSNGTIYSMGYQQGKTDSMNAKLKSAGLFNVEVDERFE